MKHRIKLPEKFAAKLLKWPEDGMDYQIVDVVLKDGRVLEQLVVLNAEILEAQEEVAPALIVGIRRPKRSNAA